MIDLHFNISGFKSAGEKFANAAKDAPDATRRAINHTGDKARTAMRVALVIQTGLQRKTMNKAVVSTRASSKSGGNYTIRSKGGNVRLQFFHARETRAGVSAAPWNQRQVFASTFIKGGRFPNRVALNLGGAVLIRSGKARFPLKTVKSGLFIPDEMVKGQSAQAFFTTVERDLPDRLAHELLRGM
jgi:hypothetical protein